MKKIFLVLIFFLFSSTSLLAEYRLEPVNCTLKKKSNCGAYLYNSSTGATYFCDSEKCTEIMPALEEAGVEEEVKGTKKSKIPKKPKKKKKKSKIPKFKKKKSE
ncbi:uncharacterized protein METZ01_LOCUS463102 [marine metagenome]|uniref:Uncharacterized protein n=1 Tax=marine metagenome TaxID=408172 RepID=A0A383ASX7_9ZZZZ